MKTQAYRGYLIHCSPFGNYWITKDGMNICSTLSVDDAKRVIDLLLD
jgi:hypothetical protein